MLKLIPSIFFHPHAAFASIRDRDLSTRSILLGYLLPLALIAPVAAFVGTTVVGWSIGSDLPVKLTSSSAAKICVAYFFGIVIATVTLARFIQWMSETYGARQTFQDCLILCAVSATPLYLGGFLQAYPVVWLNYIVGLPLLCFSIYLLYLGLEVLFYLPKERVFLFGASIVLVGMVALVGLLVSTVLLWGTGFAPVFEH